jgi:hypothetical protein
VSNTEVVVGAVGGVVVVRVVTAAGTTTVVPRGLATTDAIEVCV